MAKRGARVVLLGRRFERLEARADSIRVALSEAQIDYQDTDITTLVIDFSDMESVRLVAAEAMSRFPKIHGLILSVVAVLVQKGPNILPSGHELMFVTNITGPFLFTHLLLEPMQQLDDLVLHVIAPFYEEIDWDDLENIRNHKAMTAYERIKTMHRVIAAQLLDGMLKRSPLSHSILRSSSINQIQRRTRGYCYPDSRVFSIES